MKINTKFFNEWEKLKVRDRLNFYIAVLLVLVIVVLSIAIYKLVDNKMVVILPPRIDKEFYVVGDKLSTAYLEQVTFFLSDRIMSISPYNAKSSFDAVIPFLSDNREEQKRIKVALDKQADLIIKEKVYQSFYPAKIDVDEKNNIITVTGSLRKYIADIFISEIDQKINYRYEVKSGRFQVKGIEVL